MMCIRCHKTELNERLRICDQCLSVNTRRLRRPRIIPKDVIRGTRWYYIKVPAIQGTLDSVHTGGYIHLQIDDNNGDFTWISTVDDFVKSWKPLKSQSELDKEVACYVEKTRHITLTGQISFLD